MKINRSSSTPSYVQLADHFRSAIANGIIIPGTQLPSEIELVNQSKLSRITVRRGLDILEKEGWVVRRQGLGTFVRSAINHELANVQTVSEVLFARGISPSVKVLGFGTVEPPANVRSVLQLEEDEQILLIKRLYLHGNEPLALLHIYLPQNAREQAAALYSTDPTTETTYTMWEQKFGLRLKGASNTIRAIKADTENAEVLGLQIGDPILALERITYADDGRALDYIMLYHHWERYQFSVMIPRNNPKPS